MSVKVLCLGEILVDCLADQLDQELNQVVSWTPYPGGAPANVACGLMKLGTPTEFIGCVGNDQSGDRLIKLLQQAGVGLTALQRHLTAPTRQVFVTRSQTGERHFAGFGEISSDKFADTQLDTQQIPESLFVEAKYLVMGTLGLAYPSSQKAIYYALELAKIHQVKVLVDINWRSVFWSDQINAPSIIKELLKHVDFIKGSDEEVQWLFNSKNPEKIAQKCPQVQGVLITAGDQGCTYYLGGNTGHVDAFNVKVIDTTGAGDGFVAGFIHQCCVTGDRLFQDPIEAKEAMIYANAVGALTTTQPGAIAAQPTLQKVADLLQTQPY